MNIDDFVHARKPSWERYRALLELVERRNYSALSPEEIEEFAALYRGVSADLAAARTRYPGTGLVTELNNLVSRGYAHLYSHGRGSFRKILGFFTRDYPELLAQNARPMFFTVALFLFFTAAGYFAQTIDPRLADSMVPKILLKSFEDEIKSRPMERDIDFSERSAFSSQLMTNNIQVSFVAFAGGIAFGVGTLYILIVNGMLVGVLGKLFADHGRTINYLAFIMPHGALEIPAILLSATAGFIIGYSLVNPGGLSRGDSLRAAALNAVKIMFGVVALLVIAGTIEAFFTPIRWIPDLLKVIAACLILLMLIAYISTGFIRRKTPPRGTPER